MASASIPKLLLDQHFADFDGYARQVGWDIEFRQLDGGVPRVRAALLETSSRMVIRGEYNRAYHQSGQIPDDILVLVLGLPDPGIDYFRWCRKNASGGQIVNFSLANGFDGACGAGFSGFAIALHHDLLEEREQLLLKQQLFLPISIRETTIRIRRTQRRYSPQIRSRLQHKRRSCPDRPAHTRCCHNSST